MPKITKSVPLVQKERFSNIEAVMNRKREAASELMKKAQGEFDPIVIDGVVTKYGISVDGVVFSFINNRPLEGRTNPDGKKHVTICYEKNGRRYYKVKSIDHLVATTYIPNPDSCKYVSHYDGDPTNCKVGNLFWTNEKDISTMGYSASDMCEMFNKALRGEEIDVQEWVAERFKYLFKHLEEEGIPLKSDIMLKGFKTMVSDGQLIPKYEISPLGFIRNSTTGRYFLGSLGKFGYPEFAINIDGKYISRKIHRLVAETFLINNLHLSDVHHKNSITIDPCIWNLEWISHKDNMIEGIKLGELAIGEKRSIITEEQARKVCELIDQHVYPPKIEEIVGVERNQLRGIREGRIWCHVSKDYQMPFCIFDREGNFLYVDQARTLRTLERIKLHAAKREAGKDYMQLIETRKRLG